MRPISTESIVADCPERVCEVVTQLRQCRVEDRVFSDRVHDVPSHVRHAQWCDVEALEVGRDPTKSLRLPLLAGGAQELHPEADAQDVCGCRQGTKVVEPTGRAKPANAFVVRPDPREDVAIGVGRPVG